MNFQYLVLFGWIDLENSGSIEIEGLTLDLVFKFSKNTSKEFESQSLIVEYSYLKLNFGNSFFNEVLAFFTQELIDLFWPLIDTSIASSLQDFIQKVDFVFFI